MGAGIVLALALTGVIGAGSRPDTTPIALPATAHGLTISTAVIGNDGPEQTARYDRGRQATIAQVSAAFGGAAVDVQTYADAELSTFVGAQAIRARSSGLTIAWVHSAADLGLAQPQQEVRAFGPVECLVLQQQLVSAGGNPDPSTETSVICQRTAEGLTIRVYGPLWGVQDSVDLTNELWAAVGGR